MASDARLARRYLYGDRKHYWVCRNPWRLIAFKTKAPTICGRG